MPRKLQTTLWAISHTSCPRDMTCLGGPLAGLTCDAYRMMFSLDEQTLKDGGNAILESKGDRGNCCFLRVLALPVSVP
ncbi:AAA family ATPase [Mesorhizobium zhangyense]|uniref:AAA family ATPase n=1 Tax=Mesorhizobium zhangyense TaxID=1776730 RepID=UPI0028B043A1|nr:AAA family ATPase [Mesorhizobium zhangyense]